MSFLVVQARNCCARRTLYLSLFVIVAALLGVMVGHVSAVDYGSIPGGQQTARDLDTGCYNDYWNYRNTSGNNNLKYTTNASAYSGMNWISSASNTSQTTIEVDAGSTASIQLRVNHLDYICYVAVNGGISGNNIAASDARMNSAEARSGNDYAPVPWNGYYNSPNRTFYGFGLYGLNASTGSISSFTSGAQVVSSRDDNSRFWMVGTDFTYVTPAGGFTTDQDVTITATTRPVNQYYYRHNPQRSWQIDCPAGGPTWNDTWATQPPYDSLPNKWFTDQCGSETISLKFHIKVKAKYNLTPKVTASPYVAYGDAVTFNQTVKNDGPTTSKSTYYAVRQVIVPVGKTFNPDNVGILDDALVGAGDPCDSRYKANFVCTANLLASAQTTFDKGTKTITDANMVTANYPIGTQICRIVAVDPPTQDATPTHRWSAPYCVTVVAKPYFTTTGGDISSGGVITSWNQDSSGYVGAGSELAALAAGDITGFVTGRGLSGGSVAAFGSGLAFGNTSTGGGKYGGGYTPAADTPTVDTTSANVLSGTVDIANLDSGTYTSAGDLTIFGTVKSSTNVTIKLADEKSLYIRSDINYAYNKASEIPRLTVVIPKGSIYVNATVREIHGIFYATKGNFYSCAIAQNTPKTMADSDAYATCNYQLTVYGAVTVNKLVLNRTYSSLYGTNITASAPAENFYYSPEVWLAQPSSTSTSGLGSTVYNSYVSLPPIL